MHTCKAAVLLLCTVFIYVCCSMSVYVCPSVYVLVSPWCDDVMVWCLRMVRVYVNDLKTLTQFLVLVNYV